jgi:hypothetical protein
MTNAEFSNEFDVLYNSITSNQAPGLDEYEKSVFLTKAQDEIVKSYFNPRSNKTQEGFDGNEKRQIDFSMIMRSHVYKAITVVADPINSGITTLDDSSTPAYTPVKKSPIKLTAPLLEDSVTIKGWNSNNQLVVSDLTSYGKLIDSGHYDINDSLLNGDVVAILVSPFKESFFDMRKNTKAVTLENDILMFINEYVEVTRDKATTRLTVLPINYVEYSRLMSKPHKRPLKNQAWRLLDNSDGSKKAEIVIGPNDTISSYVIRYVKRPRAIRLITFDDVTLDGSNTEQTCELDEILHPEILQRAVELAKAAYTGDLQSQIALGQASQTNIGAVQASR